MTDGQDATRDGQLSVSPRYMYDLFCFSYPFPVTHHTSLQKRSTIKNEKFIVALFPPTPKVFQRFRSEIQQLFTELPGDTDGDKREMSSSARKAEAERTMHCTFGNIPGQCGQDRQIAAAEH